MLDVLATLRKVCTSAGRSSSVLASASPSTMVAARLAVSRRGSAMPSLSPPWVSMVLTPATGSGAGQPTCAAAGSGIATTTGELATERRSSTNAARSTTWTRLIHAMESGIHTVGSVSSLGVGSGAAAVSMARPAYTVRPLATVADGRLSTVSSTHSPPTWGSVAAQAVATSCTMSVSSGVVTTRTGKLPEQLAAPAETIRTVTAVTPTRAKIATKTRDMRPRALAAPVRWRPDTLPPGLKCSGSSCA